MLVAQHKEASLLWGVYLGVYQKKGQQKSQNLNYNPGDQLQTVRSSWIELHHFISLELISVITTPPITPINSGDLRIARKITPPCLVPSRKIT